jgi:molybdate transport system ATP-binding protein
MAFEIDVEIQRGPRRIACRFAAPAGITALVGVSGAGKTSVLEAIAGLLRPADGRIAVGGQVLFDSAARIDLLPEARACGMVFQDLRLFPHRLVRENLLFGARLAPPERRRFGLEETCAFLEIEPLLMRRPRTLSGGEAQRVAIGRALMAGPSFLLMDEPLSSLDGARREEVMRVMVRIRDEFALPILLVTHEREQVNRLADHLVQI